MSADCPFYVRLVQTRHGGMRVHCRLSEYALAPLLPRPAVCDGCDRKALPEHAAMQLRRARQISQWWNRTDALDLLQAFEGRAREWAGPQRAREIAQEEMLEARRLGMRQDRALEMARKLWPEETG